MSFNWKKILEVTAAVVGTAFLATLMVGKKKQPDSRYENDPQQKNPLEGKKVVFVENDADKENADGAKGHLEAVGNIEHHSGVYEKYVKRGLDVALSFWGLVLLSPLMGAIALAIKIDDPGPVLFTQKRVGENKRYFKLHKFRSMKMSTPHEVPTHMLDNPEQYITKVGKFIRAHSLDELPQIWDIFVGNMSVVGPRPALWNQDVLTAERDKYGANDVKPGLTGWAQINGRDELEIPDKAKLDGEYCKKIGPMMDAKVFLGSLHVFRKDDSVVEGGTGEMKKSAGRHYADNKSAEELIGHIGFGAPVQVDGETEKKVLVTGAGSYIGEAFRAYAAEHYPSLAIDTIDMIDGTWREKDFSDYDIVYHVAGIAHADVGSVDDETKEKYYAVNTDLAIDVCNKAKIDAVKEFILMSSMIVYGESAPYGRKKIIDEHTVPKAANFYGDSKLQADVAVRGLADSNFKVLVIRPPMIYGRGSKGNYPTLAKLAKKLPIFPDVNNERSMLYIDNFCEFLCQIMMVKEVKENAIVLIPQNAEWTKTSRMVKEIAEVSGKNIKEVGVLAPAVAISSKIPGKIGGLVNKAFGNSCYKHELCVYEGIEYQKTSLKESIKRTEITDKRKCLCISCFDYYTTRMQLINNYFVKKGYETRYLYADFDHFSKKNNNHFYENGVKIKVPTYKKNLSMQRLYSHYMFTKNVMKYIYSYRPSVIYCMIPPNSLVKKLAQYKAKESDTKLIFDCYDRWPESFPYNKLNSLLKIPFDLWRDLRKKYISEADLIVTVSEQAADDLAGEINCKPIKIIKPSMDIGNIPNYNSNVAELTFCYLGMVNHITDIDLGVKLLGAIARKRSVTLHIIGEGQNLEEFVDRLQGANVKVVCHGVVFDMNEKNKIFSMCNLGLNIPREVINSTMSLKAVEYMRAGLPFVNSAFGDIRMIVETDDIGININPKKDLQVNRILHLSDADLRNMHDRCVLSYQNRFLNQNFDEVFEDIKVD